MDGVERRDGLYGFEFRDADKRRVPADARKAYDVKQLWQRNHEIVNLAAQGYKNVEIAEILNITPQTVSNTLNGELGKLKLSELRYGRDEEAKKMAEKIRILTNKALTKYHEILDNESGRFLPDDEKDVAKSVLHELSGLRAPTKVQSVSATLTLEELEEFKRRGREAAVQSGFTIDIPPNDNSNGNGNGSA